MDRTDRMGTPTPRYRHVMARWMRRLLWFAAILMVAWFARFAILRAIGGFLIDADATCKADAMYVLGGSPFDRGTEASKVLEQGCVPIAYCTGSSVMAANKAEGRDLTEADLTRTAAIRKGASPSAILPLRYGTSTFEEASGIIHHARSLGMDTILVVSTDFHTRRVAKVFRMRAKGSGVTVLVHAAPSTEYDAQVWWTSEQGLLMVNNEYVKTLYYFLRY